MPESIPKGLTREHVLKALANLDVGIENDFGKPTKYELVHDGKHYAPKAAIGIAFRHLTGEILHHSKFSGGEAPGQANYELRRLKFDVQIKADEPVKEEAGKAWSEEEVSLLVADYFDMLQLEILGQEYNKTEHNRQLRDKLVCRSKGSVEFKHQNVSAVLLKLGLPYVDGYKPARNYQRSLVDNVQKYLHSNSQILTTLDQAEDAAPDTLPKIGNWDKLFENPPYDTSQQDDNAKPWEMRKGRKIDYVRRDARNRRLGRLGEQFAVDVERRRLKGHGRDDLAQKVEWIADTMGDGVGFDVLSFDEMDDSERFIEVKTTSNGKYFPFFVSDNEVRCSQATSEKYQLYRLFRFTHQPQLSTSSLDTRETSLILEAAFDG
jgi:hypothetical protein